jgi:hypothetical protein
MLTQLLNCAELDYYVAWLVAQTGRSFFLCSGLSCLLGDDEAIREAGEVLGFYDLETTAGDEGL